MAAPSQCSRTAANDVVVSLSADTGSEQWRTPVGPTFPARDGSTGGPVSTPAIAGGTVFALGPHGNLVALRASMDDLLWKRDLIKEAGATEPQWGFTTSPLATGGKVIVLTGGSHAVTAFDARSGKTVWQTGSDVASYQSPMLVRIGGRELVVVGGDQFLFGLDPADGRELWKYAHGGTGFYAKIINPVVVGANGLLLTYRPDQSVLLRLDSADGPPTVAWTSRELKLNYGTPVVRGDVVFGYSGGFLTAIDARTGELKWRSRPPGDGFPILVDGHLVIAVKQGQLIVADATADGYKPKATLELFSNLLWTPPSFAEGRIFARDSYEEIAAVDVISSTRLTDAVPAEGRLKGSTGMRRPTGTIPTGKIPASQFARWVEAVEKSPDPAAKVKAFLEEQKSFPIIEGDRFVHVVYSGDAKDVQLRSDVLPTGAEIPMHRVAGTDLRYTSFDLEPDARVSYQFLPSLGETIADPRNPLKATSQNFPGDVSMIFMPRADRRLPARSRTTRRKDRRPRVRQRHGAIRASPMGRQARGPRLSAAWLRTGDVQTMAGDLRPLRQRDAQGGTPGRRARSRNGHDCGTCHHRLRPEHERVRVRTHVPARSHPDDHRAARAVDRRTVPHP